MSEEKPRLLKLIMSITRKFNLGNYESTDIFFSVGVELPLCDSFKKGAARTIKREIKKESFH